MPIHLSVPARVNILGNPSDGNEGALGAKLTGAGGGGSVFALVNLWEEESLIAAWQETSAVNHLRSPQVVQLSVSPYGLIVEHK